jgi:fused signal recognition particle receptor
MGFFDKILIGLTKTRKNMMSQLSGMFASFTGANEDFFEELEER